MLRSCLGVMVMFASSVLLVADEPKQTELAKKPQWQRLLTGEDAKTAAKLKKRIAELEVTDDYEEAIKSAEELLTLRRRLQGEDHHEFHDVVQDLVQLRKIDALNPKERRNWRQVMPRLRDARDLRNKDRYAEALVIEKQVLDICRKAVGEDHPTTATVYDRVAHSLYTQRKIVEAAPLFQKALDIRRKVLGEDHPDTADSYNNVAYQLHAQGKTAEATVIFQNALDIRRKVLGENHSDTANSYNNLASSLVALGKAGEAARHYQNSLIIRLKVLGENHPYTADSYNNLASSLDAQGKAAETQPLFQKALDIRRKVLGEDHPDTATSYINVAMKLFMQGNYAEAAPLFQTALVIRRKVLGEDHPDTADIYNKTASSLKQLGKATEAQPLIQKALDIRRKVLGEDHPDTAASYNNVARNLDDLGKASEAAPLHQKALDTYRKVLGEDHANTATSYNNMALNLDAQGKATEAAPYYQKALDIRRKVLGEQHPQTATSYNNVGYNLSTQGKVAEAGPLLEKALDIRRKVLGEDHPDTADLYNNVGHNLSLQGKVVEAAPLLQKALDIHRKILGEDHPSTAASYTNLASNLETQGKTVEASPNHQKALDIHRKILGEEHPSTAATYNNVASNLTAQGKVAEAAPLLQKAHDIHRKILGEDHPSTATSYTNLAINSMERGEIKYAIELLSHGIRSYESARQNTAIGIDRGNLTLHNPRLLLACALAPQDSRTAWLNLEKSLARSLLDQQTTFSRLTPHEQQSRSKAHQQTLALQARILYIVSKSDRDRNEEKELNTLLTQRRQHEATTMRLSALDSERAVESGEQIQAALAPDAAIVCWVDVTDFTRKFQEHWVCVVRKTGEAIWERLPGTGADGKWMKIDSELPSMYRLGLDLGVPLAATQFLAQRLHAQRIAPVLPHLKGIKRLHVVSVNQMAGIPVETLTNEFAIDYVPSGSYLARLSQQPKVTGQQLFAIGDPQYPAAPTNRVARPNSADAQLAKLSRGGDWAELPGTAAELTSLQTLFPQHTILTRKDANPKKLAELVKADKLKEYRYLHFATHGEANSVMAFQSSLILHGDDKSVARLTAREILDTWKLNAELVTLSACETAIGKDGGGDGLLGFAQAFLTAGARSVCLSLWKVDDGATALLMERFYQNLLGKRDGLTKPMKKSDALHEAKQWLRNLTTEEATARLASISKGVSRGAGAKAVELAPPKAAPDAKPEAAKKPFDHPRYWAAFILIGDPN